MKKNKLIVLCGYPGSGKSTWAHSVYQNEYILSSDEYRQKLLGDETDQTGNSKIFSALHSDMIKYLSLGYNVVYDATNCKLKDRKSLLKLVKDLEVEKILIWVKTSPEQCLSNCLERERLKNNIQTWDDYKHYHVLWSGVIDKMVNYFTVPTLDEGWDKIEEVTNDYKTEAK